MRSSPSNDDAANRYRRTRRLVRSGQAMMALGALVALSHWMAHIAMKGGPPGIQDLLVGYPTAGILIVVGAIMAGQTQAGKA